MKKLLFIAFLMMGTASFANSGEVVKPKKVKTVYTCTVGGKSCTGTAGDGNAACACARGKYLAQC